MQEHLPNYSGDNLSIERAALALALTDTREEEEELKKLLFTQGLHSAVTEIGGTVATLHPTGKLTHSVIAAAINTGVIKKDAREIHALVHAALEASNGIFVHSNGNASFALKIAMATDRKWIAVAMFGLASVHALSEHRRVGLGYMHL